MAHITGFIGRVFLSRAIRFIALALMFPFHASGQVPAADITYAWCKPYPPDATGISCAASNGNASCIPQGTGQICTYGPNPGASFFALNSATGNVDVESVGPIFCYRPAEDLSSALCYPLAPTPQIQVSPTDVDFGNQPVGTTSTPQVVGVSNGGTGDLLISAVNLTGDFQVLQNNCSTIASGSSCTISVVFTPGILGTRVGQLQIASNDTSRPNVYVGLAGVGIQPPVSGPVLTFSPPSLNFGTQYWGTEGAPLVATLTNTGNAPLLISSVQSTSADFAVKQNGCGSSLAAGGSCQISLTFMPYATQARIGNLRVVSNAATSPDDLSLSGDGGRAFVGWGPFDDMNAGLGVPITDAVVSAWSLMNDRIFSALRTKSGESGDSTEVCTPDGSGAPGSDVPWTSWIYGPNSWGWDVISRYGGCIGNCTPDVHDQLMAWIAFTSQQPVYNDHLTDGVPIGNPAARFLPPPPPVSPPSDDIAPIAGDGSSPFSGDPINTATGNKVHIQEDYLGHGSHALRFVRTYNSIPLISSAMTLQAMGPGWYSNWDQRIALSADGATARMTLGTGASVEFSRGSTGAWTGPEGASGSLSSSTDASGRINAWSYTTPMGDVHRFDGDGKLTAVRSRSAGEIVLAYDADQLLREVSNPEGRKLQFTYDGSKRLIGMVDPGGATFGYSYDSLGRLSEVTYPDNRRRVYRYEDPVFRFALTSINDNDGTTSARFTYDQLGRAIASELAGGLGHYAVSYPAIGSSATTDPLGSVQTRQFAVTGGVYQVAATAQTCDGCGETSRDVAYSADGKPSVYIDPAGNTTQLAYNANGQVTTITQNANTALARTTSIEWHPSLDRPTKVTSMGIETGYEYDGSGRLLAKTLRGVDGTTRRWSYQLDELGRVTQTDGPRTDVADIQSMSYDSNGNLATLTAPLGRVVRFTQYDADGRPLHVDYPDGTSADMTYDARGRLTRASARGQSWTYEYDANGRLAAMTGPDAVRMSYQRDAAGRVTGMTKRGEATRYTLDGLGRRIRTEVFDDAGQLVSIASTVYDGLGRIRQTIGANGQVTTYQYDAGGNQTRVTDALGNAVQMSFDALNRPILVTDPLGGQNAISYLPNTNNVGSITDAIGASTSYTFSALGDNNGTASADAGSTATTFDAAGNVVNRTDARGMTSVYTRDALGRITQVTFADQSGITSVYDVAANGVGRLASVTDPSGTTVYTYDSFGRTASRTQTIGDVSRTIVYGRDAVGRVTSVGYPSGRVLAISYKDGRVDTLALDGRAIVSGIQYFPFGPPESWIFGNGKEYTRYIDQDGRIAGYLTAKGQRRLTLDSVNRIARIDDIATGVTRSQAFTYDQIGRLTSFSGFTSAADSEAHSFTYDANGNRLSATLNGVTQAYHYTPGTNRLAAVTQAGMEIEANTFDTAGNILSDGWRSFIYDARGRMVQASANGVTTRYAFNSLGQRVKKSNLLETKLFVYDDSGQLLGEYDETGSPIQEFVWFGDIPVAIEGKIPVECPAGAYSGSEFSALSSVPNVEIRGGASGNQDWETSLAGGPTNLNGGQGYGQQNWVSRKVYRWELTYDGKGGGTVKIFDDAGNNTGNSFIASVASGLKVGNAVRFRVRAQAGLSDATISATIAQVGNTVVNKALTTAGNNQASEDAYIFTAPELKNGFTASGTFTFSFKGKIPDTNKLDFLIEAGNAVCRKEDVAFIWTDHLNTPREVTTQTDASIWKWDPLPFGETLPNDNPSGLGSLTFNMRFTGQEYDRETRLHHNYLRDYDPATGRYIQSDPIGLKGGTNRYSYALNSPVKLVDPLGLDTYDCTRPLDGLNGIRRGRLYHEFLCVVENANGMAICGGIGPTSPAGMFGSPSVMEWEPWSAVDRSSCTLVSGPNSCMESCVIGALTGPLGQYDIFANTPLGFSGTQQCQSFARNTIGDCVLQCSRGGP